MQICSMSNSIVPYFFLTICNTLKQQTRTVRDWSLLPPDIVELDTPEAFKARIVSL